MSHWWPPIIRLSWKKKIPFIHPNTIRSGPGRDRPEVPVLAFRKLVVSWGSGQLRVLKHIECLYSLLGSLTKPSPVPYPKWVLSTFLVKKIISYFYFKIIEKRMQAWTSRNVPGTLPKGELSLSILSLFFLPQTYICHNISYPH